MSEMKRTRHTAPYLISNFLNSKDSLEYSGLTATLVSILRYIYDVIEMNYSRTGEEVYNKSYRQLSIYSRASRATVTRAMRYFIKHKLVSVIDCQHRKVGAYGIGDLIKSRLTMSPDYPQANESGLTMSPALGSPRAQHWAHHEPLVRSSCKKLSKKERAQETRSALSVFKPDEASILLCQDLGLSVEEEVASFNNRHKGQKTQYEFSRWLKGSKEYQVTKGKQRPNTESRPVIPFFNPDHAIPPNIPSAVVTPIKQNQGSSAQPQGAVEPEALLNLTFQERKRLFKEGKLQEFIENARNQSRDNSR